ncbi:oxidoreductase, partial [Citrobacter sp. AAK_AS5]
RGWEAQTPLAPNDGGWPVVGPSPLPFSGQHATPHELDADGIHTIIQQFVAAAQRAHAAGYAAIEIHAAHGYLLHEFLS